MKKSNVEKKATTKLKILTGASIMAYFKSDKQTGIIVDASRVGMGVMFTQEGKATLFLI